MINLQVFGSKVDLLTALTLVIVTLENLFPNLNWNFNTRCLVGHHVKVEQG